LKKLRDSHLPRFRDVFRTQGDMPFVAETRSARLRFSIWLSELSASACSQNSGTPAFREGRVIREDKRGFIPGETPRLLERLAIDPDQFIATAGRMLRQFGSAIGSPAQSPISAWPGRRGICAGWGLRVRCSRGGRPDQPFRPGGMRRNSHFVQWIHADG